MGGTGMAGRPVGRSATVLMAVAGVVAAGCSTSGPVTHAVRPRTSATARALVPPGGSPAEARAAGQRMLASLILPPGARRIAPRSQPPRSALIGGQNVVDVSRFYWLPVPEGTAFTFLQHHVPSGTSVTGTGSGAGPAFEEVQYSLKTPPAGIEQFNMLLATLTAGRNGGTLMRADAELTWYPPRSAAEFLQPARYRSVSVTATFSSSARAKTRTITRVFTSRAVITGLARLLDGMHATAPWTGSCPGFLPQFRIVFAPKRSGNNQASLVSVSPAVCRGELITTGGKTQPALEDVNSGRLLAIIGPLLGLHPRDW